MAISQFVRFVKVRKVHYLFFVNCSYRGKLDVFAEIGPPMSFNDARERERERESLDLRVFFLFWVYNFRE